MKSVTNKRVTKRLATAVSSVLLPPVVLDGIQGVEPKDDGKHNSDTARSPSGHSEISSKKGPVFATAIIAGTMAVKKTSDLIPFCHPLPIEACSIDIQLESQPNGYTKANIECTVEVTSKTGVEMEALTGASVCALTIYDMLKALSQEMVIETTKLVRKTGGKSDIGDDAFTKS
eukprot:CAMPEP_0185266000 /NCGR_PEP_ID=MMETSP1359-20130426/29576_1 /TAXON_ID=552665 /ORGANISM="Bigelowiella longifila, Strain CCMP242" /LENGTH=173 /DNA_ID=CAMNT_0027855593 /DNA_START=106 /DNA_END=627 /DNA_ORIENTATION=-